jgi:hypothetical protein
MTTILLSKMEISLRKGKASTATTAISKNKGKIQVISFTVDPQDRFGLTWPLDAMKNGAMKAVFFLGYSGVSWYTISALEATLRRLSRAQEIEIPRYYDGPIERIHAYGSNKACLKTAWTLLNARSKEEVKVMQNHNDWVDDSNSGSCLKMDMLQSENMHTSTPNRTSYNKLATSVCGFVYRNSGVKRKCALPSPQWLPWIPSVRI